MSGRPHELRVCVLRHEGAVDAKRRERKGVTQKLGIEPRRLTDGRARSRIRQPALGRVAAHDELARGDEDHLCRTARSRGGPREETQRQREHGDDGETHRHHDTSPSLGVRSSSSYRVGVFASRVLRGTRVGRLRERAAGTCERDETDHCDSGHESSNHRLPLLVRRVLQTERPPRAP
jgi:hypothetical protein